jgi:hypothetical protein
VTGSVFEVLAIGRVSVDLYPPEIGLPLSQVATQLACADAIPTEEQVRALMSDAPPPAAGSGA